MLCRVREVRSRTNYILGTNCRLLQNVAVQDSRQNTYHYLFLGCLRRAAPDTHSQYLVECKRFPLNPPITLGGVNRLLLDLLEGNPKQPWQELPFHAWISP